MKNLIKYKEKIINNWLSEFNYNSTSIDTQHKLLHVFSCYTIRECTLSDIFNMKCKYLYKIYLDNSKLFFCIIQHIEDMIYYNYTMRLRRDVYDKNETLITYSNIYYENLQNIYNNFYNHNINNIIFIRSIIIDQNKQKFIKNILAAHNKKKTKLVSPIIFDALKLIKYKITINCV